MARYLIISIQVALFSALRQTSYNPGNGSFFFFISPSLFLNETQTNDAYSKIHI